MMSQKRFDQIWSGISSSARKVYEEVPHQTPMDHKKIASALMRGGANMDIDIIRGCLKALVSAGLVSEGREGFKREGIRKAAQKVVKDLGSLKDVMKENQIVTLTTPAQARAAAADATLTLTRRSAGPVQTTNQVLIYGLPPSDPQPQPTVNPAMQKDNIVDQIGNLAQEIVATTLRHKTELCDLAHRQQQEMQALGQLVSDSAIEVQAEFERSEADLADLAKLRQLAALLQGLNTKP